MEKTKKRESFFENGRFVSWTNRAFRFRKIKNKRMNNSSTAKKFRIWIFQLFFLCAISLFSEPSPYILATQPKAGTNLMVALLNMIHGDRPINLFCHYEPEFRPEMISDYWQKGGIPIIHLFNPKFTCHFLLNNHTDFKIIIITRDIRDAYVSYAHYICKDASVAEEEKIDRAFQDPGYHEMSQQLCSFFNYPQFYIVRFEDLVGPKGGGNKERQTEEIFNLAAYINVPISREQASVYGDRLFGHMQSTTFRQGQIGSWKKALNLKQKSWIKVNFGATLICLGYESDLNW